MKILIALLVTFSIATHASTDQDYTETECRDLIVEGYKMLKIDIKADEFSTTTFNELNISIEDFNQLTPTEQTTIYNKIKPLSLVVTEVIDELNSQIDRYVGSFYEFFMAAEIQSWRAQKDKLRYCNPQIK